MEQTGTVPLRICKTCGLEKSLDHFVSLYTDTITNNCDFCRSRQRQQYKGEYGLSILMCRNAAAEATCQARLASKTRKERPVPLSPSHENTACFAPYDSA